MKAKGHQSLAVLTCAISTIGLTALLSFKSSWAYASAASDFEEAAKLFGSAKFAEALTLFDRGVDAEPTNGTYHYWRGRCLAELGREKEAIGEYKVAMLLSADSKVKADCKAELNKLNVPAPAGSALGDLATQQDKSATEMSISAPTRLSGKESSSASAGTSKSERKISDVDGVPILKSGDKIFKLSSKKLEWDLKVSADLKNKLASGNQQLDALARNTRWALPNMAVGNPLYGRRTALDFAAAITRGPAHFAGALSEGERNTLIASDIVFVLDHSGSMSHADCPAGSPGAIASAVQSRLSWCVEELEAFADKLISALPHGFTLITFDSKPDVYPIRTAFQLRDVLNKLDGGGGTDLAAALNEAYRVHSGHPKQPLLIVVITDAEIDIRSSEQTIMEGCRRFPNSMFITMMQIGVSAEAHTADNLALLDDLPKKAGAPYDPVETIPFSQVRRDGFGRDMLLGLQRNYYANKSVVSEEKTGSKSATTK
ncbi:MAG: VWA domain-containing protein [Candidatus Obscuribacterales bacterium]|nr:VWA domain-containing protein [Candidatus Obscuribacterales bacterium]